MCSSSLPTIFYCLSMYSMSKDVSSYQAAAFLFVVFCAYLILRKRRIQCLVNPRGLPYPPGPKPLPIIGNMLDIAGNNETVMYQRLADKFGAQSLSFCIKYLSSSQIGDVVFLSAFGKHILFLNSFDAAIELFDKRSAIYSDRPQSTMSNELCV
jgi:hypothetical protein